MKIFNKRSIENVPIEKLSNNITGFFGNKSSSISNDDFFKNNATVFACINLIKNAISQLPLNLYYRNDKNETTKASSHDLYSLVKYRPNSEDTPQTFYSTLVNNLLKGNAFIFIDREKNKIVGLYNLDSSKMSVSRNDFNKKVFTYKVGKENRVYDTNEILHIPGIGYNGLIGFSPVDFAAKSIELAFQLDDFALSTFENNIDSRITLDISEKYGSLSPDQIVPVIKNIAGYLKSNYSGAENKGKPLILFDKMKVGEVKANTSDSKQLIENRDFQMKSIASLFQVPLPLITGENITSIDEINKLFVRYTLMPWIKSIEASFNKLLKINEIDNYYFEFDTNAFLRGDLKDRMESYTRGFNNGFYSINEVRKLENLTPLEESIGETHFILSNLMPLRKDVIEAYMASAKVKAESLNDQHSPLGDDKI